MKRRNRAAEQHASQDAACACVRWRAGRLWEAVTGALESRMAWGGEAVWNF